MNSSKPGLTCYRLVEETTQATHTASLSLQHIAHLTTVDSSGIASL
ncbi:MAG: hypothetical protein ACK55Z_31695 [bacterium]